MRRRASALSPLDPESLLLSLEDESSLPLLLLLLPLDPELLVSEELPLLASELLLSLPPLDDELSLSLLLLLLLGLGLLRRFFFCGFFASGFSSATARGGVAVSTPRLRAGGARRRMR